MVNYLRNTFTNFIAGPKYGFGVVEAINGNIRMPINRGRGYKNKSATFY